MRLTESEKKLIQARRRKKRTRKPATRQTAVRRKSSILPDYITFSVIYNRLAIVGGAGVLLAFVAGKPLCIAPFLFVWLVSVLRFSHSCKMQRVLNL